MTNPANTPANTTVAEELRDRASSFVNNHVDLWVTVEDDGTLVLGSDDAVALFRAAADWLEEEPRCVVADAHWENRQTEPAQTLRLLLRSPDAVVPPAVVTPPATE